MNLVQIVQDFAGSLKDQALKRQDFGDDLLDPSPNEQDSVGAPLSPWGVVKGFFQVFLDWGKMVVDISVAHFQKQTLEMEFVGNL